MEDLHSQTCYVLCAVGSYLKTEKTIKNLLEQFTVRQQCGVTVSRSQTETLKTRRSAQLQRADVACLRASVPSFQKTKHKKTETYGQDREDPGRGNRKMWGERWRGSGNFQDLV